MCCNTNHNANNPKRRIINSYRSKRRTINCTYKVILQVYDPVTQKWCSELRTYKFVKCVSEMSSKRFALLEKLTGSDMKPDIAEEKAYEVSRMSEEEVEQELAKLS